MGEKRVQTFPGRYEAIQEICQFVADGAAKYGLEETAVFHIELACDEACTNIIEHAYGGEDLGQITVSWQYKKGTFTITLHDHGRTFNPNNIPKPNLPPKIKDAPDPPPPLEIDSVKVGGLGLHFMRQLMDNVHFEFDDELGNTLTLVKKKQ